MAEFCRKCFINTFRPSREEIERIVMSDDEFMCEGCTEWGQYVDYLAPTKEMADIENKKIEELRKRNSV